MIRGNYYGIITVKKTADYTELCIESFFKNTKLNENDRFILIDNDGFWKETHQNTSYEILVNDTPKNTSQNINTLLKLSYENGMNAVLITNDVILTPKWNEKLLGDDTLSIPSCNQTHEYQFGVSLSKEDFAGRYGILNATAYKHSVLHKVPFELLMMPTYACKIPYNIIDKVGYFDESYNVGGEDVDYRIRCLQAGFDVKYCSAYLLHFNGKSSWNGSETPEETQRRNERYLSLFKEKWGQDLFDLCVVTGQPIKVIEKYNLHNLSYNEMILEVLKHV